MLVLPSTPMRSFALCILLVSGLWVARASAEPVVPHGSFNRLVVGNGHAVASFNRTTHRVDTFLEHPYRFAAPRAGATDLCFSANESRDLAYDTYFGVRVGTGSDATGAWLGDVALDGAGYVPGTGIFYADQHVGSDRSIHARTYGFMPAGYEQAGLVMLLQLTNEGASAATVTPYALFNFHLGAANGGRDPSSDGEQVSWDNTRQAFYEYGGGQGTIAYAALSSLSHRTASTGASGAYSTLQNGADLDDVSATSGPTNDVSPGFEGTTSTLAAGESAWFAVGIVWALDADAGPKVNALQTWANERTPDGMLAGETADWSTWIGATPHGLNPHEAALYRQSLVTLRMAQVREGGAPYGQIIASLPPGLDDPNSQWNISWVRDMAYATVAFARTGHMLEALAALQFQLNAPDGKHTTEVGMPYRISVCRYFGDGEEESDCNANGPNIEFDGFGLFLWSLGEYVRAGGQLSVVRDAWPVIENKVGNVLVSLIDSDGSIHADSSIWETHWNGQQKRFTYTSITAARGLCDAAEVATMLGYSEAATRYSTAGARVRDAIVHAHTDSRGTLAQSVEDLLAGSGYLDAAAFEAVNMGIIDPNGRSARATLAAIRDNLRVASGYGFKRNDDNGAYDSKEWVFIDLRLATAPVDTFFTDRSALWNWNVEQAANNNNLLSELYDPVTGDYTGSIPMAGFGAGAYVLAATRASSHLPPACGAYAAEPSAPDAGLTSLDGGAAEADGGVTAMDAGMTPLRVNTSACAIVPGNKGNSWFAWCLIAGAVLFARKRRSRS